MNIRETIFQMISEGLGDQEIRSSFNAADLSEVKERVTEARSLAISDSEWGRLMRHFGPTLLAIQEAVSAAGGAGNLSEAEVLCYSKQIKALRGEASGAAETRALPTMIVLAKR